MKRFLLIFLVLIMTAEAKETTVAIIQPIEHKALNEIADGMKKTLAAKGSYKVEIHNAQGDINSMRAIAVGQAARGTDVICPIGTNLSRMVEKVIAEKGNPQQIFVALAVGQEFTPTLPKDRTIRILDEIPASLGFAAMRSMNPGIKKIALVYSPDERLGSEIKLLDDLVEKHKMVLQKIMVNYHQELYTAASALHADVDAIFVLKDHLVVAGIKVLAKIAKTRKIPLIASDEGSVLDGADLAFCVRESEIGVQAALAIIEQRAGNAAKDRNLSAQAGVMIRPDFARASPTFVENLKKAGYSVREVTQEVERRS